MKEPDILKPGKLPYKLLDELLRQYTSSDESVVEGPATGIDAALLRIAGELLFAKTDPVTFVTEDLGYYVVNINANDLAAMGGEPGWFLVTLLFPAGEVSRHVVETVFAGIREACEELSVSFCGGHTEVTDAVRRIVAIGTMLGQVMEDKTFQASYACPGDTVVLTKGIAIEGTSIIGREKRREVIEGWGEEFMDRCAGFLKDPGISVLREAKVATRVPGVRAMHDPTEGGLSTALHELADAAGTGFVINRESIPIFPETKVLCERYGLDPLGLIASGSLLITVTKEKTEELVNTLRADGVCAERIGNLVEDQGRRKIVTGGTEKDLQRFESDEILRL
jgi:hydrogenase maturation factor